MELTDDEKQKFLMGVEFIKVNTKKISEESAKQTEVLKELSEHLKHLNWNLGLIGAYLTKNKKVISDIEQARAEETKKTKKD